MRTEPMPTEERELTPRQRDILRLLVREYVSSASPVGSQAVLQAGGLAISSATVRNELGVLEELGYVFQPHTSAGRVPTVRGYRYFVEQLMEEVELPLAEQRMIRHQFHQIRLDLEQWMRLTAAVLAHTAGTASLVTPPRAVSSRFRHLELISISDSLCLLIVVLQDSSIHQEMLALSEVLEQSALSRVANRLNDLLRDRTVREIETSADPGLQALPGLDASVLERVLAVMRQADRRSVAEIYRDGLVNVLRQPEFGDADKFRQLVEMLEHRALLESILAGILNANGVQIIIGGEGPYEEIDEVSLVLSPYGIRGKASGVLGIMGPIRMRYDRAISTVRYVAEVMNDLIVDVYGLA